ncbi:MAG: prepilin peptidase, partial [Pseudomonadales bacterium]|nr:prepilin peptidase [Pseudomonadales bacterium]
GYGDFKLLALLGAWLGWQPLLLIIILSSFAGIVIAGTLILFGRDRSNPIPFGPYLALAGWAALLRGDTMLIWYLEIFV